MAEPPPLPLDPPSPLPRAGPAQYVAWGVIVAVLATGMVMAAIGQRADAKQKAVIKSNALQLQMTARMTLGMRELIALAGKFTSQPLPLGDVGQYVNEARKQSASPGDALRVVILEAEVTPEFKPLEAIPRAIQRPDATAEHQADAEALTALYRDGPSSLTPEQRQRLLDRYGWFAELALVYGQDSASPARKQLLASALRSTVGVLVIYGILGITFFAGLAMLIIAIIQLAGRKLRLRYVPDARVGGYFLEGFAIYLGGMFLFGLLSRLFLTVRSLQVSWLMLPIVVLALCWPRIRGASWEQVRHGLGLQAGQGVLRELALGAVGCIAAMPLLAIGLAISLLLTKLTGQFVSHPIVNEVRPGAWNILGLYALACVFAPVTEELLFRGALFHHLRRRWGFFVSTLMVSLIFAALHPQGLLGIPMLTLIAFVLAGIRQWRSSILGSMMAHAMINGTAVTLLTVIGT